MNLAVNLLLLCLVVVYLALIYWTYADAKRRIDDPMLVGCATAASFFPFVGTIVYMIVRPPEYIEDGRERELEIAAAEARLADMDHLACPYCDFDIEKSFLRCPSCLRRLKEPCATCGKPLDPRWKICPYCEAEIGQARRRAARRAGAAAQQPAVVPVHRTRLEPSDATEPTMDRTLILVKPDAFARNLTGEIIARFERKGLRIAALKHMQMDRDLASQHYAEHEGKPFFGELVAFITSGPLVAMVLEGHEAVVAARQVIGATNPLEANTGSIRGDYALEVGQNMVHGSDSNESAEREAKLFFPEL